MTICFQQIEEKVINRQDEVKEKMAARQKEMERKVYAFDNKIKEDIRVLTGQYN